MLYKNDFNEIIDTLMFGINAVKFSFFKYGCTCTGSIENQFREYMWLNELRTILSFEGKML